MNDWNDLYAWRARIRALISDCRIESFRCEAQLAASSLSAIHFAHRDGDGMHKLKRAAEKVRIRAKFAALKQRVRDHYEALR